MGFILNQANSDSDRIKDGKNGETNHKFSVYEIKKKILGLKS